MASIYYIDGYNVIHHSTLFRPLAAQNFEAARDALIEHVSRFCVATGHQAKVVFDGRGRQSRPPATPVAPGVEVMYSPGHQSADALIERIVYAATNRREIIVVSGDRGIRTLCRNLNALVMEPDNFLESARDADQQTQASLQHLQRPDVLNRMEGRLDSGTLDRLVQLRDHLKK